MSHRDFHRSTKAREKAELPQMSPHEHALWERLKDGNLGFNFKRQVPVLEYDLDFFCPEVKVNVEIEGGKDSKTRSRVARRMGRLGDCDIETIRVPLAAFEPDQGTVLEEWVRRIEDLCWERRTQ